MIATRTVWCSIERRRAGHASVTVHMTGACAARKRPQRTHVHARASCSFASLNCVAAVARSYRRQREVHHFLDATAPERFSFDNHAFELLHDGALPARLGAARLLSRLIGRAQLTFGRGPIALDDDDRGELARSRLRSSNQPVGAVDTSGMHSAKPRIEAGRTIIAVAFRSHLGHLRCSRNSRRARYLSHGFDVRDEAADSQTIGDPYERPIRRLERQDRLR